MRGADPGIFAGEGGGGRMGVQVSLTNKNSAVFVFSPSLI